MRSQTFRTKLAMAVVSLGTALCAAGTGEGQPFIGVHLDDVPEVLAKHLRLEPGKGVLIVNVAVDSPADKAGLERDDVIVAFQGRTVSGADDLRQAVRRAQVDERVSLEVIHRGERKTVELALAPLRAAPSWRHRQSRQRVPSWSPGRFYTIGPEGREWVEVPPPGDGHHRLYNHRIDGEDCLVIVQGDPADDSTRVSVHADGADYITTVGELDALPEKYRDAAKDSIEDARGAAKEQRGIRDRLRLPGPPSPEALQRYFRRIPAPNIDGWSDQKDRALERLQEQMQRLQERMRELEQRNRQMLNELLEKKGRGRGAEEPEQTAPPESENERAI